MNLLLTKRKVLMLTAMLAVAFLAVPASLYARPASEAGLHPRETTVTIFHTNDIHGRVTQSSSSMGIDRVPAIRESVRNSLLVDVGDNFWGAPIAALNTGADMLNLLDLAGYDLFTPGNHDFDYGFDRLLELHEMARVEFVSSNIFANGELVFNEVAIREVEGVRIGFFGLTSPDTPQFLGEGLVGNAVFGNVIEAAKRSVAILQAANVDVIVALAHIGTGFADENNSGSLAMAVPEIDIIIDGHSHTLLENGNVVNGVLIASAGDHLRFLGRIDIVVSESGGIVSKSASVISRQEALSNFEPQANVTAALNRLVELLAENQDSELAFVVTTLDYAMPLGNIRSEERPIGNLIADAARHATGADMAAINSGGIRADLESGDVTVGNLFEVLPFGNEIEVFEITPAQLAGVLEHGIQSAPEAASRFLHVSGFSFTYDPNAEPGSRVLSITFGGAPLNLTDSARTFTIAVNNFMAGGGDGFVMFESMPFVGNFGDQLEQVIEFIQTTTNSYANVEGRIVAVPDAAQR